MSSTATPIEYSRPSTSRPSRSIEWDEVRSRGGAREPQSVVAGFSPLLFLLRHWFWMLVAMGAAGYAAWQAAERFTSITHNAEAQLLYNQNNSGAPDYESPSLMTLMPIVESRRVFEHARDQLQLPVELTDLEEALEIEIPYESNLLLMNFKWPDEAQGIEILTGLMDAFMREVSTARANAVQRIHTQYESTLSQYDSRLSESRKALQDFNDQAKVIDIERDLGNLQLDLQLIEATLAASQRRRAGQEAQLGALNSNPAAPGTSSGSTPALSSPTLDMERWRVLRDLVSNGQQELQQQTQIEFKQKEYDRARRLHEQKYISDAEFEQVAMQLRTLQTAYDPSLQPLKSQLESIEKRVPGSLTGSKSNSPLLPSTVSPAVQIELALLETQADAKQLEVLLMEKQTRLSELMGVRQEGQMLQDNVTMLTVERDRVRQRLADLSGLLDPEPTEFAVMQPPSPALKAVTDNRRKLLAGTFCACLLVLLGPVVLWDAVAGQRRWRSRRQAKEQARARQAALAADASA